MRTASATSVLAVLLLHAPLGARAIDFTTGTTPQSPLGEVNTATVDTTLSGIDKAAPPTASSRSPLIRFDNAGSLDVGTLDVGSATTSPSPVMETQPPTSKSQPSPVAVQPDRNNSGRFSVEPPSSDVDLQGFPFLTTNSTRRVSANVTTVLSTAAAFEQESDEWMARVCSGAKTSCKALQPTKARRLADSQADGTQINEAALKGSIDSYLQTSMLPSTTEILTEFISSGVMLGFAMAFGIALDAMLPSFADKWQEVTAQLQVQAQAVLDVAIKAATDMQYINERGLLLEANTKAQSFAIQRLTYHTDLTVLCRQDGGAEALLTSYFLNANRYRESLKAYCGASQKCVVAGGVLYAKSMAQPFANALACIKRRDRDDAKLKARSLELRTEINKVITGFLNDGETVREKLLTASPDDPTVKTIDELFAELTKMDEKAAREYAKSKITNAFSWLDFAAVVSDSTATDCPRDYKFKQYAAPSKDKGVGMLGAFSPAKTVLLAWKQQDVQGARLIDEVLTSPQAADKRADTLKSECGNDLRGMVLVSVHGDSVDTDLVNEYQERRQRHLVASYTCGGFRLVAVCGPSYKNTTHTADVPLPADDDKLVSEMIAAGGTASTGTDLNPQAVSDYFNEYADDSKSLQDLVTDFGTDEWVRGMAQRDPAVLAYEGFGLALINEITKAEVKQIDHIDGVLDQTHQAQVTALTNINNKLVETHGKEMTGLKNMENDMTKYHREEIKMYDVIDGHVAELGSTIEQGFANANSKVSAVDSAVTGKLGSLNDLIASTAQETRQKVVSFLHETTQQTFASLDALNAHINRADQKTLESVGQVRDAIVATQTKLRENIAGEFRKQEIAFQSGAADTAQVVEQVGQRVLYALLYDVDMVNNALTKQLDGIGNHVDVVKDRLVTVEKGFDDLQVQVDKMLALLSSIQQRTNRIFRTLQNFPQKVAAILLQGEVKKRLDDFKKLNYAFTRFVENGMRPLYRSEMIMACDDYAKAGDLLYYFTSNVGVEGGMDAVVKHFRKFEFVRRDYEKFGGQTMVAAYGVQRLSLTCAFLKEKLTREQFLARATLWDKEIDAAMYRFQMNVEEVIPRYFLTQHYTTAVLQGYLDDAKVAAGITSSPSTSDFPVAAIEQLRFRIQEDIGSFASVSVIQGQDSSVLRVWSRLPLLPSKTAMNRQGISMFLPSTVILWSGTRKELSPDVRDLMKLPLRPEDVADEKTLTAAFRGTVLEKYWVAGAIQTVVHTPKVSVAGGSKACPWAISSSHYPVCWEVGASNVTSGGCVCVQMEGLIDTLSTAQLTTKTMAPSFYTATTTLMNTDEPRSNFVINVTSTAVAPSALATNQLLGVPSNRVSYSVCMSSPLPPVQCNITIKPTGEALCHQPPPMLKRCIADKNNAYSIVYDTTVGDDVAPLIEKGLTVTAEMFRTLELGATLPQISFFDELNGAGNYVLCKNCVMSDFKTVFMFRIQSFKIGRPLQEKDTVCIPHPRLKNVEYCPRKNTRPVLWTSQVLVETELIKRVQQIGDSMEPGITDPQRLASLLNDAVQELLKTDFAYFKVYVAKTGSFNATANSNAYWTSLPTQVNATERGWTVVPAFYQTLDMDDKVNSFDALIMWSTLRVEERNFAKLVVEKKPVGQSLKAYLDSTFGAYGREKILRGFFSEPFSGPDCPVAGDADHFAYCTPSPVDKMCLCVQLEDLPEEYTELYDGSAPNGKVVTFPLDNAQSAYVVGRTKGAFSLGSHQPVSTWDGLPMRNVSARSVCVSDYNHPELGATCFTDDGTTTDVQELLPPSSASATAISSAMTVGESVEGVLIEAPTWSAQCTGCTGAFVAQILQQGGPNAAVRVGGSVGGGECRNGLADGGGVLTLCLK